MIKKIKIELLNRLGRIDIKLKRPKSLLIYYGFPSIINNAKTIDEAIDIFKVYDYIILGDGLSSQSHSDYFNTLKIVSDTKMQDSKVFGYIDAGVTTQNLSISQIKTRINNWKEIGVEGIFLDDFGFDFKVSRNRQNVIIDYVHLSGLKVIANAWNPDDVFEDLCDEKLNTESEESHLNKDDFFLIESYQVRLSQYEELKQWQNRSNTVKRYQDEIGFKVLSTTTSTINSFYDEKAFHYAWYSALFDEHEAISWGEENFAASKLTNPFRNRPNLNDKLYFIGAIKQKNGIVKRETNLGKIEIDTNTHLVSIK